VPNFKLVSAPRLNMVASAAVNHAGPPGVTLQERSTVSLCSVLVRKGGDGQLADRVRQEFGIELPRTPRCVASGSVSFIWAGPGQWLAMKDSGDSRPFEQRLQLSLGEAASIMDQSNGRIVVRISGPRARDVLAKGVLVDLHPGAFRPGDTAMSVVAYINVHFWQVDDAPTYEFAVFRSFAVAFWEWLGDSAAEYGVAVVD
jgi:methylglutamate dehydrogenase subunit D